MKVILVGGSNVAFYLTKDLISKGYEVTYIHSNPELCEKLSKQTKATVIKGKMSNPTIIEDAGAYKANILVALTSNDPQNLFICQIAKKKFEVPKVLAFVNNPDNQVTFDKLGIPTVFNITKLLSILIQQNLATEDISNLLSIENGKVSIYQILIHAKAKSLGETVKDLHLPDKNAVIGAILRGQEVVIPSGDTKIMKDDKIIAISLPEVQSQVYESLIGNKEE